MTRAKDGKYTGGSFESCTRQLRLVDRYWVPELDSAPRVLVHGDLSANNIIVDKDMNLGRSVLATRLEL
jgi:aminoglycoside phosphotransferase (APT) family kinase protein